MIGCRGVCDDCVDIVECLCGGEESLSFFFRIFETNSGNILITQMSTIRLNRGEMRQIE